MIRGADRSQRTLVLRNGYAPMNPFALVPALGRELEPELAQLDRPSISDKLRGRIRRR